LALAFYTLRNDIVELVVRVAAPELRRAIVGCAQGSPDVILDVLTGAGTMTELYSHRFPAARVIAVDLDSRLLRFLARRAMRRGLRNIEFLDADARELPLAAGTADLVNITFGLHELKWLDRELVLGEACRVMRPGGQLIVADYRQPSNPAGLVLMKGWFRLFEPRWVHELFSGGLEKQVADAGFGIVSVTTDMPVAQLILARKPEQGTCRGHLSLVR
jgi:ubiquinone/menaquinone biosynthesis C-methylase UbiE